MSDKEINAPHGQAAGRDIKNDTTIHQATVIHQGGCPGPAACPFERSEEERQKRFETQTGISCPRGAREALQHLLETGVFDYKHLATSWRARSLWWDWDALQLRTNVSRVEAVYGRVLVIAGIGMCSLALTTLILKASAATGVDVVMMGATSVCGAAMALAADRSMVRPNRIAHRIAPILARYYDNNRGNV